MAALYPSRNLCDNLSIKHINYVEELGMKEDHSHDFYEVYFYMGKKMVYFINDRTYTITGNKIVLIDKYTYHRTVYCGKNGNERLIMLFDDSFLHTFLNEQNAVNLVAGLFKRPVITIPTDKCKEIHSRILMEILPLYQSKGFSELSFLRSELLTAELLLELVQISDDISQTGEEKAFTQKERLISEIVSYINLNYSSQITLESLCTQFYLNKYYLCHIFRQITGMSVIEFINHKRLVEAEKLLKMTAHTITEVAGKVGFNNCNYFIKLFKKKTGVTPKFFRYLN